MNPILILYIVILCIIVLGIIILFIYKYNEYKIAQQYQSMINTKYYVGDAKNMRNCPEGCIRGTCKYDKHCRNPYKLHPKCCAFDFQCQYCKDKNGEYYLKPGENPKLDLDTYNPDDIHTQEELNEVISEQNRYIMKLNKNIKRKNKYILRRTKPFRKY